MFSKPQIAVEPSSSCCVKVDFQVAWLFSKRSSAVGKLGCQDMFGWGIDGVLRLEGPEVGLGSETKLTAPKHFSCRTEMAFSWAGNVGFFAQFGQKGKNRSLFDTPHQSLGSPGKVLVLPLALWQHT